MNSESPTPVWASSAYQSYQRQRQLTLGDLLRLRASGAARDTKKSVILVWLDGGPSHYEMFDPQPDAPTEVRGEFGTIATRPRRNERRPKVTSARIAPAASPTLPG